jgi:ADP-heptose:LPS heptosyltransferase
LYILNETMKSVKRILIYRVGHLGDTICAIPPMVAVRNKFPDAKIILLTNRSDLDKSDSQEILRGNDFIDQVITYRPDRLKEVRYLWQFLKNIRAQKSDLLIYLALSESNRRRLLRDWLFFKLAGCKICLGFKLPKAVDSKAVNGKNDPLYLQETDRLMSLLKPLGIEGDQVSFDLPITRVDLDQVDGIWQKYKLDQYIHIVAVCPASKFQSKLWPLERFAEVIDHLRSINGVKVVLIGGLSEQSAGEYLCKKAGDDVINIIGNTSFMGSAAFLSKCSLLVANDCGPVHLAAAVGTPVVGIYASIHYPGAWHPWGDIHTVLRNDSLPCRFCFKSACSHQSCIVSITSNQVVEACSGYLISNKVISSRSYMQLRELTSTSPSNSPMKKV